MIIIANQSFSINYAHVDFEHILPLSIEKKWRNLENQKNEI